MSNFFHIDYLVERIKKNIVCDREKENFTSLLENYCEKLEEFNKLKITEKEVLQKFDRNYSIYYNKTSQLYYNYNGDNFESMNEDNLLFLVLEFLSNNIACLETNQKNSFKNKIIKQIKDNNIYESIPDSKTIQSTLSLLNETFFHKKAYSKCFLITIGRIILQKKVDNDFLVFIRVNMKGFLSELNKNISIYFCNTNLFNYFKFKFTQDHHITSFKKYVIPCSKINSNNIKISEQHYVNMIIVSIYYYNRYNSIDKYMESENVLREMRENIHFLDIDKEKIMKQFTEEHIIKENEQHIQQKQLVFLWKKFTYENDIFVHSFASYSEFLSCLFFFLEANYDKESNNNVLTGYYSFDLPHVEDFKSFWNENFEICEKEKNLELNEILFLYNKHRNKKSNLSETLIKLILQCFYSHDIIDNKIINGVKCKLWDKQEEIDIFIKKYNIHIEDNLNTIYKKYVSTTKTEYRISKIYFQSYITYLYNKTCEKHL